MTMTHDDQLQATRDKMEDLRFRLAYMRHEELARIEEMLCHAINESAGTPCHESWGDVMTCKLCR